MLLLCLFTGMRINEARSLQWSQVHFDDGIIELKHTKNKRDHRVLMSVYVRKLLLRVFETRTFLGKLVFPRWQTDKPMGDRMWVQNLLSDELGIYFRSHAMRRTFRGVCRTLRIDPNDVKRMLNHKHKGDVTDRYESGKFNPDLMRQHWEEVANFLIEKRNLYEGRAHECTDKTAAFTGWLARNGLTLDDASAMLEHLNGTQPAVNPVIQLAKASLTECPR